MAVSCASECAGALGEAAPTHAQVSPGSVAELTLANSCWSSSWSPVAMVTGTSSIFKIVPSNSSH